MNTIEDLSIVPTKKPFVKPRMFIVDIESEGIVAASNDGQMAPTLEEDDGLEGILNINI